MGFILTEDGQILTTESGVPLDDGIGSLYPMTVATGSTLDSEGNPLPAVRIWFKLIAAPTSPVTTDEWSRSQFSAVSDSGGLLNVSLLQNATYQMRAEQGPWSAPFTTGTASGMPLPQFTGPES